MPPWRWTHIRREELALLDFFLASFLGLIINLSNRRLLEAMMVVVAIYCYPLVCGCRGTTMMTDDDDERASSLRQRRARCGYDTVMVLQSVRVRRP